MRALELQTLSSTQSGGIIIYDTNNTQYRLNVSTSGELRLNDKGVGKTQSAVGLTIDGGGSAITTGIKGFIVVPFDATITGWTILADQSGDIVIDVWKDTYANYPPTVGDSIAGTEKPTLSSADKNQDNDLTSWTTSVSSGDILAFNVDSVSTVERVNLLINLTRV
jgi:hypothetical protein